MSHLDEQPPAARTIGKQILRVDEASGDVHLKFIAREAFTNRHGTVGGGFLAAMLDSCAAAPLLAKLPKERTILTTELHVSFVAPAAAGDLHGWGRILTLGERDAESEAQVSTPEGEIVARATAKFRVVPRRR